MKKPLVLRSTKAIIAAAIATLFLTAIDLGSKEWAQFSLSEERSEASRPDICERDRQGYVRPQRIRTQPIVLIEGYVEYRYAENCAAAFSLLSSAPLIFRKILFTTAAIIAIFALSWMFVTKKGGPWFAWSVPFVLSGALGNLADRLRLGYVIDFIRVHNQNGFEWPTFNIADATITIGVIMMLIDGFQKDPNQSNAKNTTAS